MTSDIHDANISDTKESYSKIFHEERERSTSLSPTESLDDEMKYFVEKDHAQKNDAKYQSNDTCFK